MATPSDDSKFLMRSVSNACMARCRYRQAGEISMGLHQL